MNATKTPGQTAKDAWTERGKKFPMTNQSDDDASWEVFAQTIIAVHTPKLTAEDVFDVLNQTFYGLTKSSSRPLSDFDEILQKQCQSCADQLNQCLSRPKPASAEESRPVEWEEFTGAEAIQRGYKKQTPLQYTLNEEWKELSDLACTTGWVGTTRYRRPKKINPQPESRGENMTGTPIDSPLTQPAKESNPPEAGAPSAESGETPTPETDAVQKQCGDIGLVNGEIPYLVWYGYMSEHARTLERQRDKARQECRDKESMIEKMKSLLK